MLYSVHIFAKRQPLLVVYLLVAGPHVLHDRDLGWYLAFHGPPFREKCSNLGFVKVSIIVSRMLDTVHVECGRLMKVVVK